MRSLVLVMLSGLMAGCGGEYLMTVPEQVAPAGGEAPVVVRLQRREFACYAPAVQGAPLRFEVDGGPLRAAYTDKSGYAAVNVPVPHEAGIYYMNVSLQDIEGQEAHQQAPVYVLAKDSPTVAVDLGALPLDGGESQSADAMRKIATGHQIIYLAHKSAKHTAIRQQLQSAGMPDGPVLLWGELSPAVRQEQHQRLREGFPGLSVGITDEDDVARIYHAAGLRTVMVGHENPHVPDALRYADWGQVGQSPIAQ